MDADTSYTVSDLARMSGVTVRALHHYDEIGLLVPSDRTAAGYRTYSRGDAERLGHVLAYRACGLPLADIRALLDADDVDRSGHLRRQLDLLRARAAHLDRQLQALTSAWEATTMGINLDPDEILEVFGEHDPTQYAAEAEERWGSTDAYRESHRRTGAYTKADWQRLGAESEAIAEELAACLRAGLPADGDRAKAAAEAHREHIDRWFYPCSHDMQVALADMYVQDPRFRANYDDRHPGLADYVNDAIVANALDHIA
jgi:MerR family transcriptional regulator, thiopeptide resistance regulator